uniref:CCHC-type domain-containing protein n=1 Tax=Fagus sylvatica TaxID=28930 RepID=A0A2N9GMJ7_FAGSY
MKVSKNFKSKRKSGNCFICGKFGHYADNCRQKGNNDNYNKNKGSTLKNKANVADMEEVIAAVVSEVHLVTGVKGWVMDSTATRHIGAFREEFISYAPLEEGTENVYVRDNRFAPMKGKGKFS